MLTSPISSYIITEVSLTSSCDAAQCALLAPGHVEADRGWGDMETRVVISRVQGVLCAIIERDPNPTDIVIS